MQSPVRARHALRFAFAPASAAAHRGAQQPIGPIAGRGARNARTKGARSLLLVTDGHGTRHVSSRSPPCEATTRRWGVRGFRRPRRRQGWTQAVDLLAGLLAQGAGRQGRGRGRGRAWVKLTKSESLTWMRGVKSCPGRRARGSARGADSEQPECHRHPARSGLSARCRLGAAGMPPTPGVESLPGARVRARPHAHPSALVTAPAREALAVVRPPYPHRHRVPDPAGSSPNRHRPGPGPLARGRPNMNRTWRVKSGGGARAPAS